MLHISENEINKNKMGFTVPIHNWLQKDLKEEVIDTLLNDSIFGEEILNSNVLKSYVQEYYSGKHDNAWGVWHLYAWQKWAIEHNLIRKINE